MIGRDSRRMLQIINSCWPHEKNDEKIFKKTVKHRDKNRKKTFNFQFRPLKIKYTSKSEILG